MSGPREELHINLTLSGYVVSHEPVKNSIRYIRKDIVDELKREVINLRKDFICGATAMGHSPDLMILKATAERIEQLESELQEPAQ